MSVEISIDNHVVGDFVKSTSQLYDEFLKIYPKQAGLNQFEVPRISAVILSTGYGKMHKDTKTVDEIVSSLSMIATQKVVRTVARKSVSNFKLREGSEIGAFVTLRDKSKIFRFLDHYLMVAAPRTENFQGFSINAFDDHNNFNFGIEKHNNFIVPITNLTFGFNVCICVKYTVKRDKKGQAHKNHRHHVRHLFKYLGFPFWNEGVK